MIARLRSAAWILPCALLASLGGACGSGAPKKPAECETQVQIVDFVDLDAWQVVPRARDPFAPPPPRDAGIDAAIDAAPDASCDAGDAGVRDAGDAGDAGTDAASGCGAARFPPREGRQCTPSDVRQEALGPLPTVSIRTQRCSWVTIEQPSIEEVRVGDRMRVRVWYFSQTIVSPAEAALILAAGDEPFWTATVPLPTESGVARGDFPAAREIPRGTMIRWHVSNHGANSWNLLDLSVTRPGPCP